MGHSVVVVWLDVGYPSPKSSQLAPRYGIVEQSSRQSNCKQCISFASILVPGETMSQKFQPSTQPWLSVAGFVVGAIILLFFMAIVVAGLAGHHLEVQDRVPIVLVFSIGLALAFSFIGGDAAAKGKIPFIKDSPVVFSVSGGIAVFIICFLIGMASYPKDDKSGHYGDQTINSTGDGNTNTNSK